MTTKILCSAWIFLSREWENEVRSDIKSEQISDQVLDQISDGLLTSQKWALEKISRRCLPTWASATCTNDISSSPAQLHWLKNEVHTLPGSGPHKLCRSWGLRAEFASLKSQAQIIRGHAIKETVVHRHPCITLSHYRMIVWGSLDGEKNTTSAAFLYRIVGHYIDGVFISSLSGKLAHFPRALGHILCSGNTTDPPLLSGQRWEKKTPMGCYLTANSAFITISFSSVSIGSDPDHALCSNDAVSSIRFGSFTWLCLNMAAGGANEKSKHFHFHLSTFWIKCFSTFFVFLWPLGLWNLTLNMAGGANEKANISIYVSASQTVPAVPVINSLIFLSTGPQHFTTYIASEISRENSNTSTAPPTRKIKNFQAK